MQVRSVVLIALLAVARKFIILDLREAEPAELFALAVAVLALGIVYWLVRDQDRRAAVLVGRAEDAGSAARERGLDTSGGQEA